MSPIITPGGGGSGGSLPFSGVSLQKNTNQTGIALGGYNDVTWQVEDYDTDAYFAAPGTEVTIPSAGYYLVEARVLGSDVSGINGQLYLKIVASNGDERVTEWRYDGTENEFAAECVTVIKLAAANTVKIQAELASDGGGTTWSINGSNSPQTHFTVTKLGAVA